MKKLAIAGASVALAAMPVVSTFAASVDGTMTATDIVTVTIDSACSLATSGSALNPANTYTANITPGGAGTEITGSTFTVTCNDAGGWNLKAVGTGDGSVTTSMYGNTGTASDDIITGTTLDGTASNWAFKITASTGVTVDTDYSDFAAIPSSADVVASHAATSLGSSKDTVTATYKVAAKIDQKTGAYTGKVTYTLAHPATNV